MGTLVSDSIPSLINGVSQQPPSLRLPSQVGEQINAYPSEVDGLRKRAPLIHVAKLTDSVLEDTYLHTINRDAVERYEVVMGDGSLRVFDSTGAEKTVAFPDGTDYLSTGGTVAARQAFRAVTVADYTFVMNRTVTTAMTPAVKPSRGPEALVVFKQGSYGKRYAVTITRLSDNEYAYGFFITPDGSDPTHVTSVSTDYIAEQVRANLSTFATPFGYTVDRIGSVLHIYGADDFAITVTDDLNNNGASGLKGLTQRFSSLPNTAPEGFHLEILGDDSTAFDNFYVEFQKVNPGDSTGVWKETLRQGAKYAVDAATMPHVLVREADGTFTFKRAAWDDRKVGDDDTNPFPSFIGKTITDLLFYRNRLGFISRENVAVSGPGSLFNFFATTVATLLDDAPVDIAVTTTETAEIRSAAPFAGRLLLFGDQHQIAYNTGDILTARSVSTEVVARFASNLNVRPVGAGTGLFFVQEAGLYSRLRELYVTDDGVTLDANDVTTQAPMYVPSGVFKIIASTSANLVVMLNSRIQNELYFYKFYYDGRQKMQSALFKWTLPEGALLRDAAFLDTDLYVVYSVAGEGTFIGYFPLAPDAADPDSTYLTHLDRRVSEGSCALTVIPHGGGLPTRTQVTLPYRRNAKTALVSRVDTSDAAQVVGEVPEIVSTGPNYITVAGDWSGRRFFVGDTFSMRVQLSRIFMRKQSSGGGSTPIIGGRLQLRYLALKYAGTGFFSVLVKPASRAVTSMVSTGRRIGQTLLNQIAIEPEGTFRFPVQCRNTDVDIEIVDATHLPAKFQSLEWEGFYTNRDRSL